jgi:hypothetical protein
VKDLAVHPRDQDLVLGSYARGVWVTNIAPLQELTPSVLAEDAHLFSILPTTQRVTWSFGANDYLFGQRLLQTPNDADGMTISYYLKNAGGGPVSVTIADASGKEVARLNGPTAQGINHVVWSTRVGGGGGRGGPPGGGGGRGGRGGAGAGRGAVAGGGDEGGPPQRAGNNPLDQWMPLGEYKITLDVGGKTQTTTGKIVKTIGWGLNGASPKVIR